MYFIEMILVMATRMTGLDRDTLYRVCTAMSVLSALCCEVYSSTFIVIANSCEYNLTLEEQFFVIGNAVCGLMVTAPMLRFAGKMDGRRSLQLILTMTYFFNFYGSFMSEFTKFRILKILSPYLIATAWRICKGVMYKSIPETKKYAILLVSNLVILFTCGALTGLTWLILSQDFSFNIPYLPVPINSWRVTSVLCSLPAMFSAVLANMVYGPTVVLAKFTADNDQVIEFHEEKKYRVQIMGHDPEYLMLKANHLVKKFKQAIKDLKARKRFLKRNVDPDLADLPFTEIEIKYKYIMAILFTTWLLRVFFASMIPLSIMGYLAASYEGEDPNKTFCQTVEESVARSNFSLLRAATRKYYIPSVCSKKRMQTDSNVYMLGLNLNVLAGVCFFLAIINIIVITMFSSMFMKHKTKITFFKYPVIKKRFFVAVQFLPFIATTYVIKGSAFYIAGVLLILYVMGLLSLGFISTYRLPAVYDIISLAAGCTILGWLTYPEGKSVDLILGNLKHCEIEVARNAGIVFCGLFLLPFLPSDSKDKVKQPEKAQITYDDKPRDVELALVQLKV